MEYRDHDPGAFAAQPSPALAQTHNQNQQNPFAVDYNFPSTPLSMLDSRQLDCENEIGSIERAIRYARYQLQCRHNSECRRSLQEARTMIDELLAVIPPSPLLAHEPNPVAGPSSETQYGSQKRKTAAPDGQRVEKALKFNGYEPPARVRHTTSGAAGTIAGTIPPTTTDITLTLPGSTLQSRPDGAGAVSVSSPVHASFPHYTPQQPFPAFAPPPGPPPAAVVPVVQQQQQQQQLTPVQQQAPQQTQQQQQQQQQQSFGQAIAHIAAGPFETDDVKPVLAELAPAPNPNDSPASSASPAASTTTTGPVHSTLSAATLGPNDMSPELRLTIDEIFFSFLDGICSNLDATDPKGEPIHQTLMAKKMQRLDESPDYRPFRFRIQAFTNGFLETLATQGYPEDKLPTKKVRHYLWTHPYISRYNEEGKKTKSKGNHIWSVEARKVPHHERAAQEGDASAGSGAVWTFRKFERRIAGAPPGVAYVGVRWAWTPRVWDPQAPRVGGEVQWSSEGTLDWMRWDGDELSGVPRADSQGGDVVVVARFVHDGKDIKLEQKISVQVAPMGADVAVPPRARRPTLDSSRRNLSDSAVQSRRMARRASVPNTTTATPATDRVTQVVAATAKRVNIAQRSMPHASGLRALAKQEQVLLAAAASGASAPLVAATQDVVLGAAQHLQAEKPPGEGVMVDEVILATQAAVAQAVLLSSEIASDVDVMRTARALQQNVPAGAFGVSVHLPPNAINELGMPITVAPEPLPPLQQVQVQDVMNMGGVSGAVELAGDPANMLAVSVPVSLPVQGMPVDMLVSVPVTEAGGLMPAPEDVLMQPDYASVGLGVGVGGGLGGVGVGAGLGGDFRHHIPLM